MSGEVAARSCDARRVRLTLLEVPYDCGRYGERMGSGPLALAAALPEELSAAGHDVQVRPVRLPGTPERFFAEVAAVIALQHEVRREVAAAREAARLPVVLSGNCGYAALGAVAALPPPVGVLWLDAHAAGERLEIAAVSLTAYDASGDPERRGIGVAARLLGAVAAAARA